MTGAKVNFFQAKTKILITFVVALIAGFSLSAFAADELYYYEFITTCGGQHSESSYVEYTEEECLEKWNAYEKECETTNTGMQDVKTIL